MRERHALYRHGIVTLKKNSKPTNVNFRNKSTERTNDILNNLENFVSSANLKL